MAAIHESKTTPARSPWAVFLLVLILCLAPVFGVGGFRNGFTYWNALPVVVAFGVLAVFGLRPAASTFAAVTIGFTELFHFAWFGDWGGTATSSSTSAILFVFIPFWSILFGLIAAFVAWLVARFARRTTPRSPFSPRRHRE
jgi:hypothetical protein